jgi:glycine cleavage system transcriptional repressor
MSQKKWFAMAAIGRDRPGIVADLAECVYACGCNLEDASMTMLGTEFATLMLVSGNGTDLQERLYQASKRLEWERRLTVFLRPVDDPGGPGASA